MSQKNKSNVEILSENATAGYEVFEERMLKMTKESIYNNAHEIHAKVEIHGYLCDCAADDLNEEEIEVLVGLGVEVVKILYDYFSEKDDASIMYYSDITDWVRDFCEEAANVEP